MALVFIEGFDSYTDEETKWRATVPGNTSISGTGARTGANGMVTTSNVFKSFEDDVFYNCAIVGMAWQIPTSLATTDIFYFTCTSVNDTIGLSIDGTGVFEIESTFGVSALSTYTVVPDTWYYLEMKVVLSEDDSKGHVSVRVDNVEIMSIDGGFNDGATIDGLALSRGYYDDIYILNDSGTTNIDYLGPVQVETLFPNGNTTTDFSVTGAASNYEAVDEIPPDDDTSYVSSSTATDQDIYTFDNLSTTLGQVFGVQYTTYSRKNDPGGVQYQHVFKDGGTTLNSSATQYVNDDYNFHSEVQNENPALSTAWNITNVNSAEFGFELL